MAQETTASTDTANTATTASHEVTYNLKTRLGGTPSMAFVGVGGEIDEQTNPLLTANVGDTVTIHLVNSDPVIHDFKVPDFNVTTGELTQAGQEGTVTFVADRPGDSSYICSVVGHEAAGMKGTLRISGEASTTVAAQPTAVPGGYDTTTVSAAPADPNAVSIIRNPTDLPVPVGNRAPMHLQVDLTAIEVKGQLADGTTFDYFTFDGQVPGPMIRIRVGDMVDLHFKNADGSLFPHSIDLHAVTGPGGGAVYTQMVPGQENIFTFQALNPGLYVYHCATASIPHHISSGMYGMILVEPEGGLPPVSREFYVMQGEIYTEQPFGTPGQLTFSMDHLSHEDADYMVFNGAAGALTKDEYALHANVGDTVRIYFGVGGPNYTSSFHVIGEIFDRVYETASLTSEPLTDVQTTLVPPGGATVVEFTTEVPGRYILVDHALSRLERGLAGYLYVDGADNPEVYHSESDPSMAGH
jgi:nitrite reductase (NO-forming)